MMMQPPMINSNNTAATTAAQAKENTDKTARSIFVGNIPYEATEEKLTELFCKAGPVLGFRLVYDRESGKPKGYGFCEYSDASTSASALRNLQNIEFNGRPLRIGPAAGEQNSAELALSNPSVGPPMESPYGDRVDSSEAPEAISRAVASLPPDQMYELMKQMKLCIQNNPNEARNMLLQNPQLAYALLQAQIVMKIVDPKVAIAMLNRSNEQIPPIMPESGPSSQASSVPHSQSMGLMGGTMSGGGPPQGVPPPNSSAGYGMNMNSGQQGNLGQGMQSNPMYRPLNPQGGPMRGPGGPPPHQGYPGGPGGMMHHQGGPMGPQQGGGFGPSGGGMRGGPGGPPPQFGAPHQGGGGGSQPPQVPTSTQAAALSRLPSTPAFLQGRGEQEKAALIMQVLQLSDEQIALLPVDQRRSILILKEQLGKSNSS